MKIAILTTFQSFIPGYSLTGIVKDQARMLASHGHEVHLFVSERYKDEEFSKDVIFQRKIPFTHQKDYHSKNALTPDHKEIVKKTADMIKTELADFDMAFTHDFLFIGWFLPFGLGCVQASHSMPNLKWLHWCHSIPSAGRDWWDVGSWGPNHKLAYPNQSDALLVAEQYRGTLQDVRVIPHIKDMRSWYDLSDETCQFIKDYPAIMHADFVQIYPASVDRLETKRVKEVMHIFSEIKKANFSICLVIACQWATKTQQAEEISRYKAFAEAFGLKDGVDVIWIPDWQAGKYKVGLPKAILRELMYFGNLFIFPTRDETFGLVLPEAVLSGAALPVLNQSLDMMLEISGHNCLHWDFGSFRRAHQVDNWNNYANGIAGHIVGRMMQNEALMCKTFMRQRYNWDYLYNHYYWPIMQESRKW